MGYFGEWDKGNKKIGRKLIDRLEDRRNNEKINRK